MTLNMTPDELNRFRNATMTFIIGRSGSGKSTLENYLATEFDWRSIESYTTRPQRYPNEPGHIYITMEDVATNPEFSPQNRIAETTINNHLYFATKEQFKRANLYVIDPNGFYQILNELPNEPFNLIYLNVSNEQLQKQLNARAEVGNETQTTQQKRLQNEAAQFDEFEQVLKTNALPSNVNLINHKKYFANFYKKLM